MSSVIVHSEFQSMRADAIVGLEQAESIIAAVSNPTATTPRQQFIAGETISAKDLLSIGTDGKVYKASGLASDSKSVFAIAYNSGSSGSTIETYNQGETIQYDTTFNIGKTVFLSSAGTPTTNYNYTVGNLYQRIGIAINSNSFVIKIEESKEMM